MSKPRMWTVPVEMSFDMVVVAETQEEAEGLAATEAHDELSNADHEFVAYRGREVAELHELPEGWDAECCPYYDWYADHAQPGYVDTVAEWLEWLADRTPTESELEAAGQLNALTTPNGGG